MASQFTFHGTVPGLGEVIEAIGDKLDEVLQQQNKFAEGVRQQQRELATQVQALAATMARIENRLDKASAPAPSALAPRARINLLGQLQPIYDRYHPAASATTPASKDGDAEISSAVAITVPTKRPRGRGNTRIARDNGLTQPPPTEIIETRRGDSDGSTTDSDEDDVIPKRPRVTGRPSTHLRRPSQSLTSGSTDVLQKEVPASRKQVATDDVIDDEDEDDTIYVRPRAEAQLHLERDGTSRPAASLRPTQRSKTLVLPTFTQDVAQDDLPSADLIGGFNIRGHHDQVRSTNNTGEATNQPVVQMTEQPISQTADPRTAEQSTTNEIVDEAVVDQAPTDQPTTATARPKKATRKPSTAQPQKATREPSAALPKKVAGKKRGINQDIHWLQTHSQQEASIETETPAEAPVGEQPATGQRRGGRRRIPKQQEDGFGPTPAFDDLP